MCRPRVGEANPLFSLCRALWRPTAPASRKKAVGRQKESRTNRKPISSPRSRNLKVIQKCVHLKCICIWCLDNWSRILSGKPFNTFSMARLKTLQFRLTLTPLFTATHAFLISLSPFFFSWSVIGVVRVSSAVGLWLGYIFFILVTLNLCLLLIHRDLWNSQK
jgi:hypothetical protein